MAAAIEKVHLVHDPELTEGVDHKTWGQEYHMHLCDTTPSRLRPSRPTGRPGQARPVLICPAGRAKAQGRSLAA